jgi:hypothetical protein
MKLNKWRPREGVFFKFKFPNINDVRCQKLPVIQLSTASKYTKKKLKYSRNINIQQIE